MLYRLTLLNDSVEVIDQCFMELPDSVNFLYLGTVVDEQTTVYGYDKLKIHVEQQGGPRFQTTVLSTIPSATVVAALIINHLRTTEPGSFVIRWGQ